MAPKRGTIPVNKLFTRSESARRVIRLYLSGLSINNVGLIVGCHKAVIRRILEENNISIRFSRPGPELTIQVKELYKTMSGVAVAEFLNITPTTVYGRLEKAGIPRRGCSEYAYGTECDHEYFDQIDTEQKAYWLYMLNADGCITDDGDVVLSLRASDAHHVERFRQAIRAMSVRVHIDEKPKKKVIHGRVCWTKHASLAVHSPRMVDALLKHGILPRKTGRTITPIGVPAKLMRHGWRGAVDGDGWVAMSNGSGRRNPQAIIGLTGDWDFVAGWAAFVRKHAPTIAGIQPNHNIWKFAVTDSFAITIGQVLYDGATVMLERKHEQFLRILKSYAGRADRWEHPTAAALLARGIRI